VLHLTFFANWDAIGFESADDVVVPSMVQPTDYDTIASSYDRRYTDYDWSEAEQTLARFAGERALAVLEVGCGTGHWLARLREHGAQVSGLDRSPQMLAIARSKLPGAQLELGSAEKLPWPEASFDRVFALNAIHHFEEKGAFVREARRVLRPGGGIMTIGIDPHVSGDRWWVYDYWERSLAIDLERVPSAQAVRSDKLAAGFTRVDTSVATHACMRLDAREALTAGLLDKKSGSELALLSEAEYSAGLQRVEQALAQAEARGCSLELMLDLRLFATVGWLDP
jgi:SAM-dependent methyltransferase